MTIELPTKQDFQELDGKQSQIIELPSNKKSIEQKEWIETAEVKSILGCSDATLKNYRDTSELPYSKIGGTYYYPASGVKALLYRNLVSNEKTNNHANKE